MYDSLLIDFFVLVVFLVLSGMVILVIPATLLVNQQLAVTAVKLLLCCRNQFKSLKKDNKYLLMANKTRFLLPFSESLPTRTRR